MRVIAASTAAPDVATDDDDVAGVAVIITSTYHITSSTRCIDHP